MTVLSEIEDENKKCPNDQKINLVLITWRKSIAILLKKLRKILFFFFVK